LDYALGRSADNQVKDLMYATAAEEQDEMPGRLTPVLLQADQEQGERGRGQQDHAAVQDMFQRGTQHGPPLAWSTSPDQRSTMWNLGVSARVRCVPGIRIAP